MATVFVKSVSVAGLLCVLTAPAWSSGKSKPCSKDLQSCPDTGCAPAGSGEGLTNQVKRRSPKSGKTVTLNLDDFQSLQDQADDLVGEKKDLPKAVRATLKKLKTSGGEVAEGDLVQVSGFLVGTPHANVGGESVNCRLKGTDNNDFHIPMARTADDTEFEGIVVEMIPQDRPAGWTVPKLRKIAKVGRQVRVAGQLFYDNKHKVNSDPEEEIGGQPKRFSLWEIHPVSGFEVCTAESCDQDSADWTALADYK